MVVIKVSRETREKLKALGRKGETYDDIIRKLLKLTEKRSSPSNLHL
ncbi:MAG: DUF7557 family protein [Candidatus Hecatellaceae archaeon]